MESFSDGDLFSLLHCFQQEMENESRFVSIFELKAITVARQTLGIPVSRVVRVRSVLLSCFELVRCDRDLRRLCITYQLTQ